MRTYTCPGWTPGEKVQFAQAMRVELEARGFASVAVDVDNAGVHVRPKQSADATLYGLIDTIYLEHAAKFEKMPKTGADW